MYPVILMLFMFLMPAHAFTITFVQAFSIMFAIFVDMNNQVTNIVAPPPEPAAVIPLDSEPIPIPSQMGSSSGTMSVSSSVYHFNDARPPPDVDKIIAWMTFEYTRSHEQYCTSPTYGRGVGTIPICDGSSELLGLICYRKCNWDEERNGLQCVKRCPSGMSGTIGIGSGTCFRMPLTKYVGYKSCSQTDPSHGWTQFPLTCTRGQFPQWPWVITIRRANGDCGMDYGNFFLGSCSTISYGRSVVLSPIVNKVCAPGTVDEAGLCYPPVRPGYHCPTPNICYKSCEPGTGDCGGLGCSPTVEDCSTAIADKVVSTVLLPVNLLTLGAAAKLSPFVKMAAKFKNIKEYKAIADAVSASAQSATSVARAIADAVDATSNDLARMTSPLIAENLQPYRTQPIFTIIITRWVNVVSSIILNQMATDLGQLIGEIVDPTGIVGMVNAFNNPSCKDYILLKDYLANPTKYQIA